MITQHSNQQAGQTIPTDAHPKAWVETQSPAAYNVECEETIIRDALNILARRMRQAEAVLNSPATVRDFLKLKMAGLEFEVFNVIFLDAQHGVIASEEMFRGTLTQTSVYPREVVKRALFHNAAAVIFAHNHPSGVCEPSRADQTLTDALKQALALVDVRALDHFIVAGTDCLSFAERGLI
ncbi:MAG: DNA repair protein RadC [Pseudomonadota bacterium]